MDIGTCREKKKGRKTPSKKRSMHAIKHTQTATSTKSFQWLHALVNLNNVFDAEKSKC